MNAPRTTLNAAEVEAIEARFALRVCASLNASSQSLPHDISERLRVARLRAVEQGRLAAIAEPHVAAQAQGEVLTTLGSFGGRGDSPRAWRIFASVLPLVILLVGLASIRYLDEVERIEAAAEVDASLLADDLPPQAYADPGFAEFINSNQSRN
ncbi:DUF3619 family protein [Aquabacterium sp.]|uniref:DUF3619 family protein n=1 Tax=Aquabacterium sp. TaxID=1872578 RepID=UPI0035ADE78A